MCLTPHETADLVTFTEEIFNGKLHFLCNVRTESSIPVFWRILGSERFSE